MAFDPDIYLKEQVAKGNISAAKRGFDPDAYLNSRANIITSDVPTVAGEVPNPPVVREPTRTMADKLKVLYEVPAAVVTGAAAPFLGIGAGAIENIRQGTNKRLDSPEFAQRFQYQPTSPVSQDVLQSMGSALEASKLPPIIPNVGMLPSYSRMASTGTQQAQAIAQPIVQAAPKAVNNMAQALRRTEPTLSGAGAAEVPQAVVRAQMAEQLRVPIKLSKGQATRDLGQQQFEIETMKTYPEDVGRPLIAAQELRNLQIGQNLDAYVDATGAKVANPFLLRPTGEAVDTALRETANKARKEYKSAYDVARASEEGQQKVNVQGIIDQLDTMEAEAVNAPVINSAKIKLGQLAKDGEMTLNEIEEVRKMVNRLSGDTPSNMAFGGDIKTMIDAATENAGGDLFKEARRKRTKFANEFENIGLINDLLSKKPNSSDRVVSLERVFDKAVMQSDLDSLKSLGYTLKKTEKGQQAWAELKGQTIENLRNAITSNIETDSLGQRTFNPKQFDVIVKNLDKSGKLDYLLGKAGAQEIRNLRDTAIAINSPVKGINTSNTSSAINKVFNDIIKKTVGKIPLGGQLFEAGAEAIEKKNIAQKVQKSLEFKAEDVAKELRKGK
jgi:acyl-CoA-binding protein